MERTTVSKDGFCGIFHEPSQAAKPAMAVMVLGGSEGNENIPMNVGRMFAERGIAALGICFWNAEGLPREFVRLPLEPFAAALAWLRRRNYREIYLYGISDGAKTALLTASLMPDFAGVIALSPMHCIWNGKRGNKGLLSKKFTDEPEYSYKDRDFSYMKIKLRLGPALRHLLLKREIKTSYLYEDALRNFDERSAIEVEKINGDLLFIYAQNDTMWPSKKAVQYMMARLEKKAFAHSVCALEYEKASHILVPLNPKELLFFRIERKYPDACRRSREDAFEKTISWLLMTPAERVSAGNRL